MESGTRFAVHEDLFKEIVLQMETIGEPLDETRQLVLLLGSLTDEYRMISTVLENTPNMTLAYAIQALSGVDASDELSSAQQKAFVAKKSYDKRRFNGKCFYCKTTGHKEKRSAARRRPTRNAGKSRGRRPTMRSQLRVRWARLSGSSNPVQARTRPASGTSSCP
ncbi:hypothetical protein PF010_g23642 [Phytophthora fragariae]|uniref:Uncharacterized protein n=1 Tax=Phytophthora fragariae TaxID=53985 RepID=A0A6A3RIS3_9STRA|nr:hypothetical protein PF010_g23642 [Phytophthora fragariae]KAE9097268.1 hypothetical protein PF006_g23612 [Phytophthora fragariae]KAE9278609.1 hypothetical protein PF001_g25086 [Phytophthora fragariae]